MINLDCAEISSYIDTVSIPLVDIANICCGAYAGSNELMVSALHLCKNNNVKVSAHIGYPDRENFGRLTMNISQEKLLESLHFQLNNLIRHAKSINIKVEFIKCHGALYHDINLDRKLAVKVLEISKKLMPEVKKVISKPGSIFEQIKFPDFNILSEGFADRKYKNKHQLVKRNLPTAMLNNMKQIVSQYKDLLEGKINTIDGWYDIDVSTICFHGDHNSSIEALKELRK